MWSSERKRIAAASALGIAYLGLACAAIGLTRFHGGVAFISVANSLLLARLLTRDARDWPLPIAACSLAGAFATATVGLGPAAAIPMIPMNVGEALVAAMILRRTSRAEGTGSSAPLAWFLVAGGIVAPALTACGGAAVATAFGSDTFVGNWKAWFTGHALGTITFTPFLVYLMRGDARSWLADARTGLLLEAAGHAALVTSFSVVAFSQDGLPLLFLPMLPVVFTAFRTGRLGAAVAIVILAVVGCGFTVAGHGPIGLIDGPAGSRLQFLQFYLACTVLLVLPVAAELARRTALFRRLRESEARYRLLTENSTDIVLNLDVDGRILFVSPSITQLSGLSPEEVVGRNAASLVLDEDVAAVRSAHVEALRDPDKTVIVEYRAPTAHGEVRWFETHTRAVVDDDGTIGGVVSAVRDVSHRKSTEDRLHRAAMTDTLTGLANRRAFDRHLEAAIARADQHGGGCVALFDLDRFKSVNDRYGHAAGDTVLKCFAETARGRLRGLDLVARHGGEEFAVILPGASVDQAVLVCDRIRRAIAASPIRLENDDVVVTVSGGVAPYDATSAAAQVMAAADAALYEAKHAGRDRLALAA